MLTGPALVRSTDHHGAFGWTGRVEAAAPLIGPLAVAASLRGIYVPSYRNDAFQLGSFGIGVRLR